ncbi:MAG TPA: zinc ribbon domain-containing protein [Thermoanaerobaculia bacterium]|nr:zinc ribbon domain-containing protein [Thermoanaerobaculia bacterium]
MPLYEYQCVKCGRKVEVIQSFSDPPPAKCLHCGGTLAKLLSSPAFQFKGSGFYATDYGRSGGKPDDSSKGIEGDSSKGKEAEVGAASDAGAGTKGDSAGDSSKEKKDSKDSSKERSDSAQRVAKGSAAGDASTEPSSPSKKNTKRK